MLWMIRAGRSGFAGRYYFALPDNFTANCWWWPLTTQRQQSALYQPAIMRACGDFLADITSFFKINSGQLIKASFEHQRAFRHQINGPFGNGLPDAARLPIFIWRGFGAV